MKVTTPELPQNKPPGLGTTVDGSEIWRENKLRLIVYPIIYGGFLHPRWLFGISYINSMLMFTKMLWSNLVQCKVSNLELSMCTLHHISTLPLLFPTHSCYPVANNYKHECFVMGSKRYKSNTSEIQKKTYESGTLIVLYKPIYSMACGSIGLFVLSIPWNHHRLCRRPQVWRLASWVCFMLNLWLLDPL